MQILPDKSIIGRRVFCKKMMHNDAHYHYGGSVGTIVATEDFVTGNNFRFHIKFDNCASCEQRFFRIDSYSFDHYLDLVPIPPRGKLNRWMRISQDV